MIRASAQLQSSVDVPTATAGASRHSICFRVADIIVDTSLLQVLSEFLSTQQSSRTAQQTPLGGVFSSSGHQLLVRHSTTLSRLL
jgi:hypothetical protein